MRGNASSTSASANARSVAIRSTVRRNSGSSSASASRTAAFTRSRARPRGGHSSSFGTAFSPPTSSVGLREESGSPEVARPSVNVCLPCSPHAPVALRTAPIGGDFCAGHATRRNPGEHVAAPRASTDGRTCDGGGSGTKGSPQPASTSRQAAPSAGCGMAGQRRKRRYERTWEYLSGRRIKS